MLMHSVGWAGVGCESFSLICAIWASVREFEVWGDSTAGARILCELLTGPSTRVFREHSHVASCGSLGFLLHGDLACESWVFTSKCPGSYSRAYSFLYSLPQESPVSLLLHPVSSSGPDSRRKLDSASWQSIIRQQILLQPSLENTKSHVWEFLYFEIQFLHQADSECDVNVLEAFGPASGAC